MTVTEMLTDAQDRMFTELEANQERVVEFNKKAAETFQGMIPTQLLDEVSIPSLPGMEDLPSPTEMIDTSFEFAGKLAETTQAFYKELFDIWMPAE